MPAVVSAVVVVAAALAGCGGHGRSAESHATSTAAATVPKPATTSTAEAMSPFAGLTGYLAGRGGEVTAAVYDTRTNQTWSLAPTSVQDAASIVKVEIMGTALQEAQAAKEVMLPPSEAVLMTAMIEKSDNDSASELLTQVGGVSAVARFDQAVGMTDTTPAPTMPYIPGTTLPGWGLTTTTALDQVTLVKAFALPSTVLTPTWQHYGLALMEAIEADQDWGVSAGAPAGATVALKDGWLPLPAPTNWQVDSIGWISGSGSGYVLAVLTRGSPNEQYGIDTIETIARAVAQALG